MQSDFEQEHNKRDGILADLQREIAATQALTAPAPQARHDHNNIVTAQDQEDIVQPLLSYSNNKKYYLWHHQHATRALALVTAIRNATTFEDINAALIAERNYYPGYEDVHDSDMLSAQDREFSRIAKSYPDNNDSGYYKAITQAILNTLTLRAEPINRSHLKTGYK